MFFSAVRSVFVTVTLLGFAAVPAATQTFTLTATLTGAEEDPAVNTGAFGTATVTVDVGARTVTYRVDVFNLPSGVTAAHIHVGAAGTAGPVVVSLEPPVQASNDFAFTGTVSGEEFVTRANQGIRSADDMIQAILAGNSYVNVHSSANRPGEIRGRLVLNP